MSNQDPGNRFEEAREIFVRIMDLPDSERAAFLEQSCRGNPELLEEVVSLLKEAESPESPFEDLVNATYWPALTSLSHEAGDLERLFDEVPEYPVDDPLIGRTVSGFEIIESIGRGGMGMVYRALDQKLDRIVALKLLPPGMNTDRDAKDRFIHEARAASGLQYPNIATIHEIGETEDGQMFIAMGYYPGKTLKEVIARGPIPGEAALDYAMQLATGLKRAHEHGVVHRDIKPGNIMITDDGTLVLLDFGLAKLSHESGYTQVGQWVGTLGYMSPEQARGAAIDERTDIWSFGVVLYEMLTGRRPFDGDNPQTVIRAILEDDPEPPASTQGAFPGPLTEILGLCLAKDPDHRYHRAGELVSDLQRVRDGLEPKKKGGRATWNRRRQRRWIMPGALMVALIVVTLLVVPYRTDAPAADDREGLADKAYPVKFTRVTMDAIGGALGRFVGSAWGDFDNDGLVDLIVVDQGEGGRLYHHRNIGGGRFERVSGSLPVKNPVSLIGVFTADVDNDGDLDLFFTADEMSTNRFLRNDGTGSFVEVTEGHWVNTPSSSQAASWGDYDADGWIDLFVANSGLDLEHLEKNFLYHNRGDGTMESVQTAFTETGNANHGGIWTDFDGDGDVDLALAGQNPLLFRNRGDRAFEGFYPEEGGIPEHTKDTDIGFASADYDNDGDIDLVYVIFLPDSGVQLYRNDQNKVFRNVSHVLPSEDRLRPMSVAWGDYDNDGYQDLLIANFIGENRLYHNDGGNSFLRITESPVERSGNTSAGCAWVDYDNDGDLDVFVSNGMWSTFDQSCELLRNEGSPNNWIVVKLTGTASNRSAIGAKVWAQATIRGNPAMQLREVQSGGHAQNATDQRVHFGLGDAEVIEVLRIDWPSGQVQELRNVAANQFLTLVEEGS